MYMSITNIWHIIVCSFLTDSVISTPSTPNSSLSSQSNLYGSPNISPATPTQQPQSTPPTGSSGHKNSLKGTKLARRARSFKDDLFEKISLMRTPTNTLGRWVNSQVLLLFCLHSIYTTYHYFFHNRSQSPQSPRNKNKHPPSAEEVAKSSESLDIKVKDIMNALKHFKDVILKKKLEVLPGNGTVILETTANMFSCKYDLPFVGSLFVYRLSVQSTVTNNSKYVPMPF